ncbi:MAG: ATP-binding protein, partial [Dehalococcoidia bacterium]
IAPAIENARLFREVKQAEEENRRRLDLFWEAVGMLTLEDNADQALSNLVGVARELVGARYGALAVWNPDGGIARWIVSGLSLEEQRRIGTPPRGLGVLGLVREEGKALRLADVSTHPRAHGFPPGHPPVKGFLGIPIAVKGRSHGALYLANKQDASGFSEDDELLLSLLALLAGVLLDNAALYEDVVHERGALAAIQSSMAEGLVVLDSGGRIAYFNQAASSLLNLSIEEAVGKPIEEVIRRKAPDFESPEASKALVGLVKSDPGASGFVEVALTRPQRRDLVATSFPILSELGEKMAGLLLRDVTLEREDERHRDAFMSIASHELRIPLTSMLGFAELLLQRDPPRAVRKEWLSRIHGGTQRLIAIVDDLLSIARIQLGKLTLNIEEVSLADVVEEALALIKLGADSHSFLVDIPSDLPPVYADGARLRQVLLNLLDNAVKYSPEGGRITVSACYEPEHQRVVGSIADQGIGLSPEDQEGLFTTFHRVLRPEVERVRGTGLGLYIVKELVGSMKGEVWVESELGKGSAFSFSLPIA